MVTFPLRRKLGAEDIAHGHNRSLSSFKGKLSGIGCKNKGARLMTFPQSLGRSSAKAMASTLLVSVDHERSLDLPTLLHYELSTVKTSPSFIRLFQSCICHISPGARCLPRGFLSEK